MNAAPVSLADELLIDKTVDLPWIEQQLGLTTDEARKLLYHEGVLRRYDGTFDRLEVERALYAEFNRRKAEIQREWTPHMLATRRRKQHYVEDVGGEW